MVECTWVAGWGCEAHRRLRLGHLAPGDARHGLVRLGAVLAERLLARCELEADALGDGLDGLLLLAREVGGVGLRGGELVELRGEVVQCADHLDEELLLRHVVELPSVRCAQVISASDRELHWLTGRAAQAHRHAGVGGAHTAMLSVSVSVSMRDTGARGGGVTSVTAASSPSPDSSSPDESSSSDDALEGGSEGTYDSPSSPDSSSS